MSADVPAACSCEVCVLTAERDRLRAELDEARAALASHGPYLRPEQAIQNGPAGYEEAQ